jgi:hypothetical protein
MHATNAFELDPLISLEKARAYFPARDGRQPCRNSVKRWTAAGCRGVRLRSEMVGAVRCTRPSWVAAFLLACNPAPAGEGRAERRERLLTVRDARRDAQTERYLASRGYYGAKAKKEMSLVSKRRGGSRPLHAGLSGGPSFDQDGESN